MQVQLQRLDDESGTETRLYCRSEERLHKELAMSEHFQQLYEDGLRKLNEGLSKPYTHKTLGSVERRLGRLAEKSKGISQHYRVEVIADGVGKKASHIQWQLQEVDGTRQTHPGVYCLRTNKMDWDEETMWRTYVLLTEVESVFRCLKIGTGTSSGVSPEAAPADAHLFITTLAFQLVPDDSASAQGWRLPSQLESNPQHHAKRTANHSHIQTCGWANAACAQSDPCGNGTAGDLSASGDRHRIRRHPQKDLLIAELSAVAALATFLRSGGGNSVCSAQSVFFYPSNYLF